MLSLAPTEGARSSTSPSSPDSLLLRNVAKLTGARENKSLGGLVTVAAEVVAELAVAPVQGKELAKPSRRAVAKSPDRGWKLGGDGSC